jgi:hypothetical protein
MAAMSYLGAAQRLDWDRSLAEIAGESFLIGLRIDRIPINCDMNCYADCYADG